MCGTTAPQGAVDHETFLERKVLSEKGQLLSKKNKMAHAEKLESWHRRAGRYALVFPSPKGLHTIGPARNFSRHEALATSL
jgi:hypothetical protein